MNKQEQIQIIAKLFNMSAEEVENNSGVIEECNALYFSIPEKGGHSLIIGEDGGLLYADSSVGFTKHLQCYKEGKRTEYNGGE